MVVGRRAKHDWNRSELSWCRTFQAGMNHVIVVAVSTQHLSATFLCARRANRGSAMGALCYRGAAAPPLRISRTVFDCTEGCHIRLGFPPPERGLPCVRCSQKDRVKSTAFLVAQIFLLLLPKFRCNAFPASQVAENKTMARLVFLGGVDQRRRVGFPEGESKCKRQRCWVKKTMFRGSSNEHRNTLSSTEVCRHASQ